MKCLITGASGFIGSHVLDYLLKKTDWNFVCPCSFRHKGNPLRIQPNDRVKVVTLDLTGVIPDLGDFDYILNLASESHVDRSIKEPVAFVENNISLVLQTLEYARKHKPKVFIQFSTDEVFGDSGEVELQPSNPYSASKASQELIALAYRRTYGVPVIITNTNNVIGENQDPEKFVPKITKLIRAGEVVELHVTKDGQFGTRYYNHAENVAAALLFILQQGRIGERYNLPGGAKRDNLEMAQAIADLLMKELKAKTKDAGKDRPGYDKSYPEPDSKLTDLGFKPPVSFEEGLTRAVLK